MKAESPGQESVAGNSAYRNTSSLIQYAQSHFDAAHFQGLMAIYGRPLAGRAVAQQNGRHIVDFVRCSYLGLDNHPHIVAGAIEALSQYGALHWSCARTRLNFSILGDLEAALSELFGARVITYSTVLAANMSALPLIASGHLTGGIKPVMVFDRLAHATLAFHKGTIATETRVETVAHNDLEALETLCKTNDSVAFVTAFIRWAGAPISNVCSASSTAMAFSFMLMTHTGSRCSASVVKALPDRRSPAAWASEP